MHAEGATSFLQRAPAAMPHGHVDFWSPASEAKSTFRDWYLIYSADFEEKKSYKAESWNRAKYLKNATFSAGVWGSLLVFGAAPTMGHIHFCAEPCGIRCAEFNYNVLDVVDSTSEPVGDTQRLVFLRERIDRFLALQTGWDGENGVAPSAAAGRSANRFLGQLPRGCLPEICQAVGDGEIVFQWRGAGRFIEVAFAEDTISWYVKFNGKDAIFSDDTYDVSSVADNRLIDAIVNVV